MLILSRVCADFFDKKRNLIFSITPRHLQTFIEAPDAIQEDPLFDMLVSDGSIEASVTKVKQKALENEPAADIDAAGKKIQPEDAESETRAAKRKTAKTDPAASDEKTVTEA